MRHVVVPADRASQHVPIPPALLVRIYAHARRCFPAECCGYLRGPLASAVDELVECRNAQLDGDHPTHPERGAEAGFVITGAELIAFARSFDGPQPARIVYHSHTNGRAYLSSVDRDIAIARPPLVDRPAPAYPVQHLVVGVTDDRITEAAQFAWSEDAGDYVEVARWMVTSP